MVKWIGFGAIIGSAVFLAAKTVGFSWIISVVFAVALPLVLFVVSFLIGKTSGGKEGSGLMKKFLKLIFWFTAIPWILHIFKAGFSDIPRATNQNVGDFLYVAAWVFTFPLMMGFCVIYAFFSSIRWIFIHPYFIAPPETIDKWIDETIEDKKCQFCAEWIKGDALICRYCGSEC